MARPQTAASGQIVPRNQQPQGLAGLLQRMAPELKRALPRHISPDRIMRICLTALRLNPKIEQCHPASFLGSVMSSAQLGLEPNTPLGHCYLVPYKQECQLIIGYQGMLDLARRSGLVSNIYAYAVRQGDEFSYALGLEPTIRHIPSDEQDREEQAITHVYAVARLKGGEPVFTVMTRPQVDKIRKRSAAANSGPWVTDFEAMALKTAVRRLWKWLPKSTEMAHAAAIDEAPELGQRQSSAWTAEVSGTLEREGLSPDDAIDTSGAAQSNPQNEMPEREPGQEG